MNINLRITKGTTLGFYIFACFVPFDFQDLQLAMLPGADPGEGLRGLQPPL